MKIITGAKRKVLILVLKFAFHRYLPLLVILLALIPYCHCQNIEREIQLLSTDEQIATYWQGIFKEDQAYRNVNTNDSIDNLNFKKVILMIKYHGYPKDNITPNVVFTHQYSNFVCEHYFPIFYDAYVNGVADTFWFMHDLRRLHRGRFGRDLVQPDTSNYQQVLERMAPYLPDTIDLGIEIFDSLFFAYKQQMESVVSTHPVKQWETDFYGPYHCLLYYVNGQYFLHKRWTRDAILPQRVFYDQASGHVHYKDNCCDSYYAIDADGNLQEYQNNTPVLTFYPCTE